MNILIPMAGRGKRFKEAGYKKPKPLIDVAGEPMIKRVLESLKSKREINFIFVVLKEHLKAGLSEYLKGTIIELDKVTKGTTCTTLLAEKHIDNNKELLIVNCDQYLEWKLDDFLDYAENSDGCLVVFNSTDPSHSYAKVKNEKVVKVAEN